MRALALAACLSLAAMTAAVAQDEGPLMPTPPPTDFTKPFQYDRAPFYDPGLRTLPPAYRDEALPVEVIGREQLETLGNPSMEELIRNLSEVGLVQLRSAEGRNAVGFGVSNLNLRNLGSGVRKIPPAEAYSARPVQAVEGAANREAAVFAPHCFFSLGESIELEGRALSCRGTLTVRTPNHPGP